MNRSLVKRLVAVLVLLVTLVVFITYFVNHPEVRQQLGQTSPALLLLLLVLYAGTLVALSLNTYATLRLCRLKLAASETFLITAYTAVVNFFGPLQSGPAFRAVYLKKKHDVNLKDFAVASLFYFFFYGLFSCVLLLSGWFGWMIVPLVVIGSAVGWLAAQQPRLKRQLANLDLGGWYLMALAAALQIAFIVLIYYAELHSVAPGISFSQAVIYTGAANLAMYVSITPGAIGFRESFLVFSQQLHHVPATTIVAANILDRAVYILFLVILTALIFGTHATRRLKTD